MGGFGCKGSGHYKVQVSRFGRSECLRQKTEPERLDLTPGPLHLVAAGFAKLSFGFCRGAK